MGWISLILWALAGVGVLGWLGWLTLRVFRLGGATQSAPPRVSAERLELQRSLQEMRAFRAEMSSQGQNLRICDRRIDDLEDALRRIAASMVEQASPPSAERAIFEPGAPSAIVHSQADVTPQSSAFEEEVLNAFNELASSFDQAVRDEFVEKYKPTQVAYEAGQFTEQDNGKFWLIDLPDAGY